jgi:hypothetical protein
LCCLSSGITDLSLLGMVSRPWSPLASLPPDVDVPLPLLFAAIPVVSEEPFELAELAGGRGVPGSPGAALSECQGAGDQESHCDGDCSEFHVWNFL